MKIKKWIIDRERTGRPCFSRDEVAEAFPSLSASSIDSSLSRFRANGLIQAVHTAPTEKEFLANMEEKLALPEYCDDVRLMLRPGTEFSVDAAYSFVRDSFIDRLKENCQ